MKALILTEGGSDSGFGHITRCVALSQGLKARGVSSVFVVNGDSSVIELLPKGRYQIFNWIKERRKMMAMIKGTDLVIIDSYLAPRSLYDDLSKTISSKADSLLMIDDCKRIDYPRGIVVNPSIYGDSVKYPENKDIKYLLGERYIILRREFWDVPGKIINKEIKNILITYGGADHFGMENTVADFFKEEFGFNSRIVNPQRNRLNAKKILNLMLKADICISGGGQTLHELARVGVPTVSICLAENQKLNLHEWQKNGFIECAQPHKGTDFLNSVAACIRKLMPYGIRLRRNKIGRNCVDGKGVSRIIDSIIRG